MPTKTDHRLSTATIRALVEARHDDPFAVLGPHEAPGGVVIRALVPGATRLEVVEEATGAVVGELRMPRTRPGCSRALLDGSAGLVRLYRCARTMTAATGTCTTPTASGRCSGRWTTTCIREGTHRRLLDQLGAHAIEHAGRRRRAFRGLGAERRAGLGGRRLQRLGRPPPPDAPARATPASGRSSSPASATGALYKYEIVGADGALLPLKADPVRLRRRAAAADRLGRRAASTTSPGPTQAWLASRAAAQARQAPISIYEVHLGSWARGEDDRFLT